MHTCGKIFSTCENDHGRFSHIQIALVFNASSRLFWSNLTTHIRHHSDKQTGWQTSLFDIHNPFCWQRESFILGCVCPDSVWRLNLYYILKILGTLHVAAAEPECYFFTLRVLKANLRVSTTNERLPRLELLNVHRDIEVRLRGTFFQFFFQERRRLHFNVQAELSIAWVNSPSK